LLSARQRAADLPSFNTATLTLLSVRYCEHDDPGEIALVRDHDRLIRFGLSQALVV
jgi:hypothetical protein